jgi:hypothetical protein
MGLISSFRVIHFSDGLGIFLLSERRHATMLQRARMQEILVDGRQLVGELPVEMFDHFGVVQHGCPRCLVRGDHPPQKEHAGKRYGTQSAPSSAGIVQCSPRNKVTRALTH